jgi:DNA (cytosine-5)-methyltransferase 1
MDGMPLTIHEIKTFYTHPKLKENLEDLVSKGYLVFEHPKDLVQMNDGNTMKTVRVKRQDLPKGYNIVAGKLSFEISKILDPKGVTPTLVATDLDRMMVIEKKGLRRLTSVEMLRLFGFDDSMVVDLKRAEIVDLLGNSVPVNIVEAVSLRLIALLISPVEFSHFLDTHETFNQQALF